MGVSAIKGNAYPGSGDDWSFFKVPFGIQKITNLLANPVKCQKYIKLYEEVYCKKPRSYQVLIRDLYGISFRNICYLNKARKDFQESRQIYTCLRECYKPLGPMEIIAKSPFSYIYRFTGNAGQKVFKVTKKGIEEDPEIWEKKNQRFLHGEMIGLKLSHSHLLSTEKIFFRNQHEMHAISRDSSNFEIDEAEFIGCITPYQSDYVELLDFRRLSEEETKQVIFYLLQALSYMHEQGIIHRDVKLENVLVRVENETIKDAKLIDFGFAKKYKRSRSLSRVGSKEYVAPEIIYEDTYDEKIDIWSLGMTMHVCMHDYYLDMENIEEGIIYSESEKEKHTPQYLDLLEKMLDPLPKDRITAQEALQHPWFDTLRSPQKN